MTSAAAVQWNWQPVIARFASHLPWVFYWIREYVKCGKSLACTNREHGTNNGYWLHSCRVKRHWQSHDIVWAKALSYVHHQPHTLYMNEYMRGAWVIVSDIFRIVQYRLMKGKALQIKTFSPQKHPQFNETPPSTTPILFVQRITHRYIDRD